MSTQQFCWQLGNFVVDCRHWKRIRILVQSGHWQTLHFRTSGQLGQAYLGSPIPQWVYVGISMALRRLSVAKTTSADIKTMLEQLSQAFPVEPAQWIDNFFARGE